MANRRGKSGAVTDFLFLDSKITANGECSHEIKRHLLLGRKAMTNLDSILKSRDFILPASLVAQLVKNPPAISPWVGRILWRRERLPIPVFWPGEFLGPYSPWGHRESDMTEQLSLHFIVTLKNNKILRNIFNQGDQRSLL